jgi:hypothetical protein
MRIRALAVPLLLVLGGSSIAEARRVDSRFLMDFAPGIAVPIADDGWRGYTGPSFKFSLRIGGELWIANGFGIAGEVDLDPEPVMTNDGVQGRFRGMIGFRLLFGFRIGAFFIRHAIGGDYLAHYRSPGFYDAVGALAVEPGMGVQFRVVRHLVIGFAVDFPFAFFQSGAFETDVQFLGFLGIRI